MAKCLDCNGKGSFPYFDKEADECDTCDGSGQICVCNDLECASSCKECCDSGLVEVNPTLDCVLTHPDSFPGCSAWMPCKCPRGKGKKVEIR